MKKKDATTTEDTLIIDLIFHDVPAALLAEFAEKIVLPYFRGNMNAAFQDLVHKAVAEQDFILSHVTHIRNSVEA